MTVTPGTNQDLLIKARDLDYSAEEQEAIISHFKTVGADLERVLNEYDIDIVVGPGDSWLQQYAAALGKSFYSRSCQHRSDRPLACPVCAMPLSYLDYNGRPIGLLAIARPHREDILINFMSAWESVAPPRQPPKAFLEVKHSSSGEVETKSDEKSTGGAEATVLT